MIPMFNRWNMEKAPALIEKAAKNGETRLLFCICLQSELTPSFELKNMGLARNDIDDDYKVKLYPMSDDVAQELRNHLDLAFAKAAELKIDVSVMLHLNSIGEINEWRQNFSFDPEVKISGWSYEDALILPVVESIERNLPPESQIDFSLQGEMGRTIFEHPKSWHDILRRLKQRPILKHVNWGVSFNHTSIYLGKNPLDTAELKNLWNACDFIGVSMYKSVSETPRADDFALNIGTFVGEFEAMRCAIPARKPIIIVEVGLGGGGQSSKDWEFHIPALNAADALSSPFYGTTEIEKNPWKKPELRDARADYHNALCAYLSNPNPRWPVSRAYLWSNGSWDVTGIENDAFEDVAIRTMIQNHNRAHYR